MKRQLTLVYLDDADFDLDFLQLLAHKHGITIIPCLNTDQVFETFEQKKNIDGLICDLLMPGVDAIDFAKQFKNKYPDKNIFCLTGMDASSPICKEAEKSGYFYRIARKGKEFPEVFLEDFMNMLLSEILLDINKAHAEVKNIISQNLLVPAKT